MNDASKCWHIAITLCMVLYLYQSIPNFVAENAFVGLLVLVNLLLNLRHGHPGLGTSNDAGSDRSGLLVPVQDLADAAVADPELPGDDARPDPRRRHLHNLEPDLVGQGAAVDEETAQLIDSSLTCEYRIMWKTSTSFGGIHLALYSTV